MHAGSVLDIWPTAIYQRNLDGVDDLNARLRQEILEREARDKSRSLGVVGGRKSSPDLLRWQTLETQQFAGFIAEAIDELSTSIAEHAAAVGEQIAPPADFTAQAWAVVYQPGGYHTIHAHHDSAWSGVYYVTADPDERSGGAIEFYDPRSTMLARHAEREPTVLRIQPAPGLIIAFPSWLLHSVAPVAGHGQRICIAFNISFS